MSEKEETMKELNSPLSNALRDAFPELDMALALDEAAGRELARRINQTHPGRFVAPPETN
jgi:hypothetical protein